MTRTKVANRRLDQLPALSRATRPASASTAPGFERVARHPASPPIRLVSSSHAQVLEPRATADEQWLAGLDAHLASSDTRVPVDEQWLADLDAHLAASDTRATASNGGVSEEHWLAGLEPADEQDNATEQSPSTTGCSAPVQSCSVATWASDPEGPPAPVESCLALDDEFDSVGKVPAVASGRRGARVERRAVDAAATRTGERHPGAPGAAAPHDDQPAQVPLLAALAARLSDMEAALTQVGVSLANIDAAVSRGVSRVSV